jgi:hypothetical protein
MDLIIESYSVNKVSSECYMLQHKLSSTIKNVTDLISRVNIAIKNKISCSYSF